MRLEQVHPQEDAALLRVRAQPLQGLVNNGLPGPLVQETTVRTSRQGVGIHVETAIETKAVIERKSGNESGCRKSLVPEDRRQGRYVAPHVHPVVAGAMVRGIDAGEQRGMRREGDRRGRVRTFEACALRGQRVDRWSACRAPAVGTDAIGTKRVDRHQH